MFVGAASQTPFYIVKVVQAKLIYVMQYGFKVAHGFDIMLVPITTGEC